MYVFGDGIQNFKGNILSLKVNFLGVLNKDGKNWEKKFSTTNNFLYIYIYITIKNIFKNKKRIVFLNISFNYFKLFSRLILKNILYTWRMIKNKPL